MPMLVDANGLPVVQIADDNIVPLRGAKPKLNEGGFMPRGGMGRSAEVVQFPQRRPAPPPEGRSPYQGHPDQYIMERAHGIRPDPMSIGAVKPQAPSQSPYDAAVARQRGRPEPSDFDQSIALLKRALNSTNPKTQANIEAAFAKFSPVERYFVEQKLGVPLGPVAPRPSAEVVRMPGFEGPLPQGRNPGQWIRGGLQGDGKPVYPKLVE
jgi:hypothetical protein